MEHTEAVPQGPGVYHKSINSGKWYFFDIVGQKIIGLVSFFVLARLLSPSDYGVIAAVFLVFGFFDLVTNPAFGDALTQMKDSVEPYLDAMWTLDLIRSLIIAVALFFFAPLIGVFFNMQASDINILRMSGLLLVIPLMGNVRQIYFFKQLDLKKIFIRDILSQVSFTTVAVLFALYIQASAWALFMGFVAQYATGTIASYLLYRSKPMLSFQFGRLRDLIGYSKWVYGQNLADYLIGFVDRILLGRLLDPSQLGFYSKAKDLATMPTSIITSVVTRVGFPAFASIQDKLNKVREGFVKSCDILALISLPITLVVVLEGGALITILMGTKWLSLVVPFKVFAFGSLFLALTRIVNAVFGALGKPKINFQMNALQAVISLPLMVAGIYWRQVVGLAAVMVVTWFILLIYAALRARRILKITVREMIPVSVSSAGAIVVTTVVDVLGRDAVHAAGSTPLTLSWITGLGLLSAGTLLFMSWLQKTGPWYTAHSMAVELGLIRRA